MTGTRVKTNTFLETFTRSETGNPVKPGNRYIESQKPIYRQLTVQRQFPCRECTYLGHGYGLNSVVVGCFSSLLRQLAKELCEEHHPPPPGRLSLTCRKLYWRSISAVLSLLLEKLSKLQWSSWLSEKLKPWRASVHFPSICVRVVSVRSLRLQLR